ncbi:MAG TPA: insulinase family protein [Holophaga sp.]|nr:insulinase family protein [Holophaga sp.]
MMRPAILACALVGLPGAGLPGAGQSDAQVFTLPSGLRCVLLEKHDQPLVRLELATRWDPSEEPPGREGIAGLLAEVLRAGGAGPHSRAEFDRALDDLGALYAFESRRNGFTWTLAVDSRSQEPALELLAHAVFRPAFDAALADARRQALLGRAQETAPWDRGEAAFLWGLGDPATVWPPVLEGLAAVRPEDLSAFHRQVVRPEASTLVIHGDLSLQQAKELVHLHFGLWGPRTPREPARKGPAPAALPRLRTVLDDSLDAELWAGVDASALDRPVRELLGLLLEQVPPVAGPGIILGCGLKGERILLVKAKAGAGGRDGLVKALLGTLDQLRGQGFSERDVERARVRWKARVASLPLHPRDQVHAIQEGLTDPALARAVDQVGAKEVAEGLRRILDPAGLKFLLLGADAALVRAAEASL